MAHAPAERHTRKQAAPGPVGAPRPVRIEEPDNYSSYETQTPTPDGKSELLTRSDKEAVARADRINRQRIAEALSQPVPERTEYDDEEEEVPRGRSRVISIDEQGGEEVGNYRFSNGAAVGSPGDRHLREGTHIDKMRTGSRPVAATPNREPARQTQISREGNTDISEKLPGGATGDVSEAMSGDDLTDLLPTAAKGPAPVHATLEWDKSAHWRTRVKVAVEQYGDNPEVLAQIKAMETPGVCKHIEEELAQR